MRSCRMMIVLCFKKDHALLLYLPIRCQTIQINAFGSVARHSVCFSIELFKVSESSAMQLSNQSDTPEALYYLFLRIKTDVPL